MELVLLLEQSFPRWPRPWHTVHVRGSPLPDIPGDTDLGEEVRGRLKIGDLERRGEALGLCRSL